MKQIAFFLILALFVKYGHAARLHPEKDYVFEVCSKLNGEFIRRHTVTVEGTYPDCVTDEKVYEFDFADKHYEGLGQAISYSRLTGKQGVLALIVEKEEDMRFVERAERDAAYICPKIKVMVITAGVLEGK